MFSSKQQLSTLLSPLFFDVYWLTDYVSIYCGKKYLSICTIWISVSISSNSAQPQSTDRTEWERRQNTNSQSIYSIHNNHKKFIEKINERNKNKFWTKNFCVYSKTSWQKRMNERFAIFNKFLYQINLTFVVVVEHCRSLLWYAHLIQRKLHNRKKLQAEREKESFLFSLSLSLSFYRAL